MKFRFLLVMSCLFLSCNNGEKTSPANGDPKTNEKAAENVGGHWEGAFTNGMKETFISFDISGDGKKLENLSFKGYWRCDGRLVQDILGPEGSFDIKDNKVGGVITEPADGGATATRYELHGSFDGDKAEGSFRMNINALACDTYLLNWTAERK